MTQEEFWLDILKYRMDMGADLSTSIEWADSALAEFRNRFPGGEMPEDEYLAWITKGRCGTCKHRKTQEFAGRVSNHCTNTKCCTKVVSPSLDFGCVHWESEQP